MALDAVTLQRAQPEVFRPAVAPGAGPVLFFFGDNLNYQQMINKPIGPFGYCSKGFSDFLQDLGALGASQSRMAPTMGPKAAHPHRSSPLCALNLPCAPKVLRGQVGQAPWALQREKVLKRVS